MIVKISNRPFKLNSLYYEKSKSIDFIIDKDESFNTNAYPEYKELILYEFYEPTCNNFFVYKGNIILYDYLEELAKLIIKDSKQAILNKNHSSMNIRKLCELKIKYEDIKKIY